MIELWRGEEEKGSKRCVEEGKSVLRGGREGKRDRCGEERKRREVRGVLREGREGK